MGDSKRRTTSRAPREASNPPGSRYLRHRLRRQVRDWAAIGADGEVLSWISKGIGIKFKKGPPPAFNQGVSMTDATPQQLEFMESELQRLQAEGAWRAVSASRYISRMFLVPKPGTNKWRLIVDLRYLNRFCIERAMKYETLKKLRNLTKRGDYMFSFDMQDGYYALGIQAEHQEYFTVNYRGQLYQLCGLPMGWSASPYYFCRLMHQMVRYLRNPAMAGERALRRPANPKRKKLRGARWKGARILPFVDDFLFIASSHAQAMSLRQRVGTLLDKLGLARNPKKGHWEPTQVLVHLGMEIDLANGVFRAPAEKLDSISKLARGLLGMAARERRWVPAKMLASLAGKAQFLYLAVPAARFYLRELHNVVSTKACWSARVKITAQLRRDLQWWKSVPAQRSSRSIYKPVETAYLHVDSSSYGWGAVLNDLDTARGFWYDEDRLSHITFKELKAVRYAVESFLPQLIGRNVLMHEDNQAVVSVVTHLTTRSPQMMEELRKLWYLLDTNDVHLRPRYIRSAANVWADRLSRETDRDDWRFNPRLFAYMNRQWGPHTIDRFASMENAQLTRFNARWRDPRAEDVDCLHLTDRAWRTETNWCNPPWPLLDALIMKLQRSGAAATVIAPHWVGESWHQQLMELASEIIIYPPARDLFRPGRLGSHAAVGPPSWSVVAARVPCRRGSTLGEKTAAHHQRRR